MDGGRIRANVDITLIMGHIGAGKTTTGVAQIADAYAKDPSYMVLSNMKLYGIKHIYQPDINATLKLLISRPDFNHIKWLVDESYVGGDSRRSMSTSSVVCSWVLQQARKRDMEIAYIAQHPRMLDWRFSWAANKRIECVKYDWDEEKRRGTRNIKIIVKDIDKKTEKTISYWGPQYWKYYNTNEVPEIPEKVLARL